jgi:hypothetical protein
VTDHFLKRSPDLEPVCVCGYRPEILDTPAALAPMAKAKTAVLNHVDALSETPTDLWKQGPVPCSPDAPFRRHEEQKYPRAGVRRTPSGVWKLTLWDEPDVVHAWDDPADGVHPDRYTACATGQLIIGAHRQSDTRLNGMPR